jgi:SAM-dependent methyltransferase
MDDAFVRHYASGIERDRLLSGGDHLELVRTLEILEAALPMQPARILDVGGGPGVYASRLGAQGYDVQLVDVLPMHVEQARALGIDAHVGDARDLAAADESCDAVLLLGPLYHLTEREDRVRALAEARRVVRAGGLVAAVGITRYASALDGVASGFLDDPRFAEIVERDLRDGQHRNPDDVAGWFTTAYFHRPDELRAEAEDAGLAVEHIVGVEGPAAWFDVWPERRELALRAARVAEAAPELSPHMLCLARR